MNNRYLAALSGIAIVLAAEAAPVSPQEALERASLDTSAPRTVLTAVTGVSPRLIRTEVSPSGSPAVYLFSTGANGFMMLPADDTAVPVLGYGDSPLTDATELPSNVAWWLSEYGRQIEYAASHPETEIIREPNTLKASRPAISPMVTSRWNQSAPFNAQCPTVNGRRTVTGCLATAMAQIMYYHKYPAAGTGEISYTDSYENSYSMTFGAFDWNNMIDTYTYSGSSANFTSAQGDAVAFLMKSCGYASRMSYSTAGSGATTPNGVAALKTYFGYNPNLYSADRSYYGIDEWNELIYNNLRDCGPVLYTGASFDGSEGHAFVCDGYSSDGFFHINWGWGGMCDGFFRLTALNPDAVGIGGGSGLGFNFYQDAILGIQPESTAPRSANMSQSGDLVPELNGSILYLSCENGFNNGFFNTSGSQLSGKLGVILENSEGAREFVWNPKNYDIKNYGGFSKYGVTVPSLDNGVYKVYPAFLPAGSNKGMRMEQQIAYMDFCYLTVSSTGYSVSVPSGSTISVTEVSNPSGFYIGHDFLVNATLTNSGESEFYGAVAVGLGRRNGTALQLVAHGNIELIDLRAGESYNKSFFSPLISASTLTPGEYIMVIYNAESGQVYYSVNCTLSADPGTPTLRATAFAVTGDAAEVNSRELSFTAKVGCTQGYFSGNLMVNLFEKNGMRYDFVNSFASTSPLFLTTGQEQTVLLTYDFADGKPGKNYAAQLSYTRGNSEEVLSQCYFTISKSEVGLDGVTADGSDSPAVYYDLTGRPVNQPRKGSIYLRRTADKVEKIVF